MTRSRQGGFALLIVLWSLVLIGFLITRLTATGRDEIAIARNIRQNAVLQAEADGAIAEAAFHLRDHSALWAADGQPHVLERSGLTLQIAMRDEAGKINPNRATPDLLQALLAAIGADPQQAARVAGAIVDWRSDHTGSLPDKLAAYRAAGLAYGPPQAPFRSLAELGLVLGMTPDVLARLTPHFSVYSTYGPTPQSRDPVVIAALRTTQGQTPYDPAAYQPVDVVSIKAVAVGPAGERATRGAVVQFAHRDRGESLQILDWQP